jgi:predicted ABC-type ATPase
LPDVIVLSGPNGAGKTTASRTVLAEALRLATFVNADVIAQGLSGFAPQEVAVEASRIALTRLEDLAEQGVDFAFETTLAARTYANRLRTWQSAGYSVTLIYFWLANPDLAVVRVAGRVRQGGHDVPESTIRQRYARGLRNLFNLYLPMADRWHVYDNSRPFQSELVAQRERDGTETVFDDSLWQQIRAGVVT